MKIFIEKVNIYNDTDINGVTTIYVQYKASAFDVRGIVKVPANSVQPNLEGASYFENSNVFNPNNSLGMIKTNIANEVVSIYGDATAEILFI